MVVAWQSSAHALHASPQALQALILSNFLHSFSHAVQIVATPFAKAAVNVEFKDANVWSTRHAAISWITESAHATMFVSFMAIMPRQCRRQSSPVETHLAVDASKALYFGG